MNTHDELVFLDAIGNIWLINAIEKFRDAPDGTPFVFERYRKISFPIEVKE